MSQIAAQASRSTFAQTIQQHRTAAIFKQASLTVNLTEWIQALTAVVVTTCEAIGWQASAKGHPLDLLPISTSEYLAIDIMAFEGNAQRWQFPVVVMELKNSPDLDWVDYALWEVLSVRSTFRIVFGYRKIAAERVSLIAFLRNELLGSLTLKELRQIDGQTLVAVGSREDAKAFPYGFFKWWQLEIQHQHI